MSGSILVIDVGTSGLRSAVVRPDGDIDALHYRSFAPSTPFAGLVEFDATEMARLVLEVSRESLAQGGPVSAPRPARWPRAARPVRRHVAPCALGRARPAQRPSCRPSASWLPQRARLANRANSAQPPCAAFCAASPPTPRNPRQSAGGSNPSPPTALNSPAA